MTLQERLAAVTRKGSLSASCLAVWFQQPYGTVRGWREGSLPNEAIRAEVEKRLSWLEDAVEHDPRLPIPYSIRSRDRVPYLSRLLATYEHL